MLALEFFLKVIATAASVVGAGLAVQRYLAEKKKKEAETLDATLTTKRGRLLLFATIATASLIFVSLVPSYIVAHRLDSVSQMILQSMEDKHKSVDQIADDLYGIGKAPPEFYESVGALIGSHKLKCEPTDLLDRYRSSYRVRVCYKS